MRILVTGATGFIGPHVVRSLAAAGHEVLSTSRAPSGPEGASTHITHDFSTNAAFPFVGHLDAIVHLAGNGNIQEAHRDPTAIAQLNAQGTLCALLLARRTGASFVLASSQRVYQPRPRPLDEEAPTTPADPYGYTKLAAESYVQMAGRLFGVTGSVLRFFSVYGPGQVISSGSSGVVAILGQRAVAGEPMVVMSHQRKDFVEISDTVEAVKLALETPTAPPRTYNIGTGVATSVFELARALRSAAESPSDIVEDFSEGDPGALVADIGRARHELGYRPRVALGEGLRSYVGWLQGPRAHPA